jgi:hypothetical protein
MSRDIIFEVKGLLPETVSVSIEKELKISEDIDYEVDTAARKFGYYAVIAEKAETRYNKMKFAFEKWQAEIEARENQQSRSDGTKPMTEAQMKSFVRSNEKYRAFQLRLIEFDEHRRIFKVIAKAFELRIELVRTKAANRRRESVPV